MKRAAIAVACCLALASGGALCQDEAGPGGRRASRPGKAEWEFAANAYWNAPREGDDYVTAILAADRGALHLEARANYESRHAQSAFVGWTFAGGEAVTWELTPIAGGVAGDAKGPVAGVEASLAAGRFDFYIEFEHVRDRTEGAGTYNYAWSEAAFRPLEWLRAGVVAQRTRVYGMDREIQRGPFVQATFGAITVGAWWFSPGATDQVFVGSLGMSF